MRVRIRVRVRVRVRVRGENKWWSVSKRVASAALASKGIYWGENKGNRKKETRREVSG